MRALRIVALCAIAAASTALACDESSELADRVKEARTLWAREGPPDYEMVLFHGCFCPPEGRGPVVVTVVAGEVVSRVYVEGGADVGPDFEGLFPDVEGLFEVAAEAARRADRVEAEFDPELGFPTRLTIDWEERAADEEVDYRVERLTPGAGPTSD